MAVGIGVKRRARALALAAVAVGLFAAAGPVVAGGNHIGDLTISKSDSPDPVVTGTTLTYTLTVSVGPVSGIDPTVMPADVTDTLPAGVTFVSATPSQGTCNQLALVVTCSLPGIPANGSATVTIVVVTGAPGSLSNTATVSAAFGDFDDNSSSNNSDTEVTTVVAATPSPSPSPSPSPTPTLSPTLSVSPTATPAAAALPDTALFGTGETASWAAIAAALAVASLAALLFGLVGLTRRRHVRSG